MDLSGSLKALYRRIVKTIRSRQRMTKVHARHVVRAGERMRLLSHDPIRAKIVVWDGQKLRVFGEAEFLSEAIIPMVKPSWFKMKVEASKIARMANLQLDLEASDRAAAMAAVLPYV